VPKEKPAREGRSLVPGASAAHPVWRPHLIDTIARPLAPSLEVEHLDVRPKPEPKKELGRQQRDVMARSAIDLHEIAAPEVLDPHQVQRQYSGPRSWNVLGIPASLVSGD
jgi:hypothetical protein